MTQYYEVLGIPETKDKAVIRKAYHKLSLVYHPDRPNGNADKFIEIKNAYEELVKVEPTKIHHQYEHRQRPYTHFNSVSISPNGDVVIDVSIRNIGVIHMEDFSSGYNWVTFGSMHAILIIRKKDLVRFRYRFTLRFHSVIGKSETQEFVFPIPYRSKWDKFMDKIKSYL